MILKSGTNQYHGSQLFLYRLKGRQARPSLSATRPEQSWYDEALIEADGFRKRCIDELGYAPYRLLGRTSPFDLEFLPLVESLHLDPQAPLDS